MLSSRRIDCACARNLPSRFLGWFLRCARSRCEVRKTLCFAASLKQVSSDFCDLQHSCDHLQAGDHAPRISRWMARRCCDRRILHRSICFDHGGVRTKSIVAQPPTRLRKLSSTFMKLMYASYGLSYGLKYLCTSPSDQYFVHM